MKNNKTRITPEWYQSANVRPKTFTATLERQNDGTIRIVEAVMHRKINQYAEREQRVDVRDFAADLKRSKVYTL
jgi:hypothetical protein